MDQIHRIRELYYEQDKNLNEIAIIMGCDWRTVRKYVDMGDFNCPPPAPASTEVHKSKLDPFKFLIDEWLQADKLAPRKQRHTAKRVYKRLKDEVDGFDCSYRLVALYVKHRKEELRLKKTDGYIPLEHHPGEGQADFGTADFYENGRHHHEAKYLVLSFPYSNGGFLQLSYGENMECLLEGLVAVFEHIGGVPTEIWFDNTRTIVTKVIKGGGRDVTEPSTTWLSAGVAFAGAVVPQPAIPRIIVRDKIRLINFFMVSSPQQTGFRPRQDQWGRNQGWSPPAY